MFSSVTPHASRERKRERERASERARKRERCAETEPERSSGAESRCGSTRKTWNGEKQLSLFPYTYWVQTLTTHEHWIFATLSRHTVSHLSSMVNLQASGKSQTQENWGLFAHQPSVGLPYPTICSTNNSKHRTQICTLVLSLALNVSRL